jgi:hypothetical protein
MKKNQQQEEPLFVGVRGPLEIRRNLLEASRGVVESLKRYETLKVTREKKMVAVTNLKKDIKDISKLVFKLRASLPTVTVKSPPIAKEKAITVVKKEPVVKKFVKKVAPVVKKPKTELDKLEDELSDIESKLNSIS